MKAWTGLAAVGIAAIAMTLASGAADAKGCLKGALVGGAAGHYAGHHGWLGAAAGCAIGQHEAKKRERMQMQQRQTDYPNAERM